MVNKRGDLTAAQIITLVVAIIGFGIVLVFLFLIDFGGSSDRDLCKLSVLTRATTPDAVQQAIPLKCKTSKICITDKFFGDRCKEQFAGEENVEYVRLGGTDADKKRIEEISANAMYDCWSMMGEGKLDLFRSFFGGNAQCVICSRVAIDKDFVQKNPALVESVNVDDYMKTHQIPGQSLTYLQAFTDRGVSSYSSFDGSALKKVVEESKITSKSLAGSSYYDMAYIFSQIKSETIGDVLTKMAIIGGAAGAATFVSPVGGAVSKFVFTPVGAVTVIVGSGAAAGYGAYSAYTGQKASAAYCETFVGEKDEKGCSIVQAVHYNFKDVNEICADAIEGEL